MNVYLHGYGSSALVFRKAFEASAGADQDAMFVEGDEHEPVTGLRCWFRLSGREEILAKYLPPCAERLEARLMETMRGARTDQLSLFGHSQGGMVALELARRALLPIASVDAFAAYLPRPLQRAGGSGTRPSISLRASSDDPYIDEARVEATAVFFRSIGCTVRLEMLAGLPHAFSPAWLRPLTNGTIA